LPSRLKRIPYYLYFSIGPEFYAFGESIWQKVAGELAFLMDFWCYGVVIMAE